MGEKKMFNYELIARQYNIDRDTLNRILSDLREEFSGDEMMVELHAIRVMKTLSKQRRSYEKEKNLS